MNDQTRSLFEVDQAMHASAGMQFINREHNRSFSLNIFRTNARELIEALRHVSDPDHGLRLMAHNNREAGTQAHREVSRRIHNFVAAAKTLVDHTRVFMKKNYPSIWSAYNEEVKERFSENQIAKFVHDLRNYMLHCGLPNSTMFIRYSQNPEEPDEAAQITTGVRLGAEELMDWDGWTAPARAYLGSVGEEVPIELLIKTYVSQVEAFQIWISERLFEFHAPDMVKLNTLREEYALIESGLKHQRDPKNLDDAMTPVLSNVALERFPLPSPTAIEINRMGDDLLRSIRQLNFPPTGPQHFKSGRPTSATITAADLIDQPIIWRKDADGNQVLAFILKQSVIYGFDNDSFAELQKITDVVLSVPWAEKTLSKKFIEDTVINWCRSSFGSAATIKLAEAITSASRIEVKSADVWAPIAHLEIEKGFSFGPVQILPITDEMINRLEVEGIKSAPSQETDIRALFDNLRSTMQGYAAVVVKLEADKERAGVEGIAIAREAVNLLRFFSPAASEASRLSSTSLLGSEVLPASHVLVLGDDGSFSYSERVVPDGVVYWQISSARLLELRKVFDATGALILTEDLDEFKLAVRSSMILFGTAATFGEPSDRLIYTLSAMEGVLLKHELEAAAYSVEERMALLLGTNYVQSNEIAHIVRAVYRLRTRHGSLQWSDHDREVLLEFVDYAHRVLLTALANIESFGTRAEFIEAIERTVRS